MHINHATKINAIIRKIDGRRKLGGIIEIEAGEGSELSLMTSDNSVVTSPIMWIVNSSKSRNELEAIVPPAGALNQSAPLAGHSSECCVLLYELGDWKIFSYSQLN